MQSLNVKDMRIVIPGHKKVHQHLLGGRGHWAVNYEPEGLKNSFSHLVAYKLTSGWFKLTVKIL